MAAQQYSQQRKVAMPDLIVFMLHELRVVLRCDIGKGGSGCGIRLLELEVVNKYCGLFFGYVTRAGEQRNRAARQHAEVPMMFCTRAKDPEGGYLRSFRRG